ncbi:MAG: hypothetical protein DSM106950_41415 [Stigonema ocellatum SAG 48.90 = DSM 106950]|nr:hypothetical protein [Stigonema ocellatum SAG 48.90 = DSM 106950]
MRTQTVFNAYSSYLEIANTSAKSMLKSILIRFLVPQWGGQEPKGERATPYEVIAAEEVLKRTPIKSLVSSADVLEQVFDLRNIDKPNRKSYRSVYKAFLKWAEENNYFSIQEEELKPSTQVNLFKKTVKSKTNHHGRIIKDSYMLMCHSSKGNLIYENDYVNEKLKVQIEEFKKFRDDNNCSVATIQKDSANIYRILGWLHRYKGISLETLSLSNIIGYQKLSVSLKECKNKDGRIDMNDLFLKKATTRQEAVELAKENTKLLEEYLDFIGGHPGTKVLAVVTCINVAKFIFSSELDDDEYVDESDFPIIRRLNQLCNKLNQKVKKTPPSIPHSHKSIHWQLINPLLDKLREKANTDSYTYVRNGKKYSQLRPKSAVFNDLQNFLSIAFMTLMPPDRSRTFYELEIGKTLVKGIYENDIFIPEDKLKDRSASKWYIHLEPKDYKTGKAYGVFWGEIYNYKFSDETFLYDYMQKWIDEGREYEQKCSHKFFFRGMKSYCKLNSSDWHKRITTIFHQETGVPVTPKELRKMYVTYLKDQRVSEAELEGAAGWMKHSRMMQSSIYDQQNKTKKMAPIQDFNRRKFDEHQNKG